jgi:hypothetical protein
VDTVNRRALLRMPLAVAAAPVLGTFAVRKGWPASIGTGTVALWRWVELPGSGLEVFCSSARQNAGTAAVAWTADGAVSWSALSATAGNVTMGTGLGLAVRKAGS